MKIASFLLSFFIFKRLPPLQNYFLPQSSPWCVINEFFHLEKKFILEISTFLCFWEIHIFQNLWHHHCYIWKLHLRLVLSTIKMKFGQILVCCMTNISKMFLVQCWTLEYSSRPFYVINMTIQWGPAVSVWLILIMTSQIC